MLYNIKKAANKETQKWRLKMATKSILNNIEIHNRKVAEHLVSAMEKAENHQSNPVIILKPVEQVDDPEKIRQIFGDMNRP